jgi:hypothetical protein
MFASSFPQRAVLGASEHSTYRVTVATSPRGKGSKYTQPFTCTFPAVFHRRAPQFFTGQQLFSKYSSTAAHFARKCVTNKMGGSVMSSLTWVNKSRNTNRLRTGLRGIAIRSPTAAVDIHTASGA